MEKDLAPGPAGVRRESWKLVRRKATNVRRRVAAAVLGFSNYVEFS